MKTLILKLIGLYRKPDASKRKDATPSGKVAKTLVMKEYIDRTKEHFLNEINPNYEIITE